MIPLRDNAPCESEPVVTYSIMFLCGLVFVGQLVYPGGFEASLQTWGEIPTRILAGENIPGTGLPAWLSMFSSMYMHAHLPHLLANLWALWLFGDNIEWLMGRLRFALFYLACGLLSSVVTVLLGFQGEEPGIGASGAIAGVMAAYLLIYPRARITSIGWFGPFSAAHLVTGQWGVVMRNISAFWYIGSWVFLELLFSGILAGSGVFQNLGTYAHAAGAIAGGLLVWPLMIPGRRPGPEHPVASDEISDPVFGDEGSGGSGEHYGRNLGQELQRLREESPAAQYPPILDARVEDLRASGDLRSAIQHCRDMLDIAMEQQNPRLEQGYRALLAELHAAQEQERGGPAPDVRRGSFPGGRWH
ncbi:rhomboid family intramembrane serine protease [bacterium]|nr:rhomboid family intramembrane serine protease [bacterium]